MNLAEQLHTIHEGSKKRIPAEKRAIMERATNDLRASGIMDRVLKVGDCSMMGRPIGRAFDALDPVRAGAGLQTHGNSEPVRCPAQGRGIAT